MVKRLILLAVVLLAATAAFAQAPVWRFDKDGDLQGWTYSNFESVTVKDGFVNMVTKYDPIFASPPVEIDANRYKIIEFRLQSSVTDGGEVFWHAAGQPYTEKQMSRHTVVGTNEPRVYRVDMSTQPTWQGVITGLRFDFIDASGATLALDYIRLLDRDLGAVPNASFEDDFNSDGRPDGWQAQAADFRLSNEHATEGDRSALLVAGPKPAVLSTSVPLDLLGRFALEADAALEGPGAKLQAELTFRDVFGKPIPGAPVTMPLPGRSEFTPPAHAASADLRLILSPGAKAWIDAVRVTHVVEELDLSASPIETWRAAWIWAADTYGKDNASAYLRKSFDLPVAPATLTDARVQATADDAYQLFVNGKLVTETADPDGWRTPEILDLKPYLTQGRNVIAVLAKDIASAEGFLLEGGFAWPGGSLDIYSDSTWKGVGQAPDGWQQPGFDDSAWPVARVITPAGGTPWGYLPYTHFGAREQVKLLTAKLPKQVPAGSTIEISATIQALPRAAETAPLRLALLRGSETVISRAYGAGMVKQVAGGYQLGPMSLNLTRFLMPGEYHIALGYPRTQYVGASADFPLSLGAIEVTAPASAEPPTRVEIKRHTGLPTLFINGKPNSFMHCLELTVGAARIDNMARNANLHLYEIDADDIGWKGDGQFDYSAWDSKVLQLLTLDPQALIMPTFDLSGLEHRWWMPLHPDELCVNAAGSTNVGIYGAQGTIISLASELWRKEAGDAVERFVKHCRQAPYGVRLVGWQPCSGVSWEWQHWGSVGAFEPTDYSKPMQQAFRNWARKQYGGDVQKLQAAWQQPAVTFDTIVIPTVEQRDGPKDRLFRDPAQWQYVIDFYKFFQDVMVDGIEYYGHLMKKADHNRTIVGTYYGYTVTMLGGARRAGDAGHMGLHRLLHSDAIDFLMSPFDYSKRGVGDPYTVMSAIGSVLSHDKLWVLQADLRTHLVTEANQRAHGSPDNLVGTVSQLERAFANATAKGSATQWYDFSNGWIARDPRQGQVINKLREIGQEQLSFNRAPDPNGIAVIVDEKTPAAYLSHAFEVNNWLVYRQKSIFENVGAPWNIYLLDDLTEGKLPKFRMYVFLNCSHMTDAQRQFITRNLQSGGTTLLWMLAPGYASDTTLDVKHVSQLTGMAMVERNQDILWRMTLSDKHDLTKGIVDFEQPNFKLPIQFVPEDARVTSLANWEGTDVPAMAIFKRPEWTSVYSAGPLLSAELVKRLARNAGVHIYTESTEPAFVGGGMIGLHTGAARTETLTFPRPTTVTDLMTGELLGTKVKTLKVKLEEPQTRLLKID
ncbi:MAG: beta-galactosidase [Armatimonadia bacterium]